MFSMRGNLSQYMRCTSLPASLSFEAHRYVFITYVSSTMVAFASSSPTSEAFLSTYALIAVARGSPTKATMPSKAARIISS